MTERYPLTWELDSLYPNPETDEFRSIVDTLKVQLTELAAASDSLPPVHADGDVAATWGEFLDSFESVNAEFIALDAFVGCHAAADAANRTFQRYEGELSALSPLRSQISTNVEFALQAADDETFDDFVAGHPRLAENRYFLDVSRRNAALRLPREQESLAADLDVDGLQAWGRLYDRISSEVRVRLMERGELVEKSPGQVQFDAPMRSVRENNFHAYRNAWSPIADTCADALNHIGGSRLSKYRRLGVDHLTPPLNLNRMRRETLDTMWATISGRKSCLVDYLAKKAELLGLEKLAWYDLQAPLPATGESPEAELPYDTACDLTIDALSQFSPDFGEFAKMAIVERWIEVEDRGGKRQGGFSTDLPTRKASRIFMTYTGNVDSMSTLVHEIGHSYHTWLLRDEPVLLRDYPMNLAETASTFAEAVLGENRLAASESRHAKLDLLDKMLSDAVAFLMNIHARFIFDDNFHTQRAGGELPAEQLNELMLAAQQEAYAGTLADDGWYPEFWVSKLHFYISGWPFYNFPYTFGYLLSLGAYSLAKDSDAFPQQFRDFLIATGCQDTEQAVQATLGFDLQTPEFWNRSLDVVEKRVQQFLELASS